MAETNTSQNTTPTIKAVTFDVGGVIELYEGERLMEAIPRMLGIPIDDFRNAYFKHNHLSNVHNLSLEEMLVKVVAEFDDTKETEEKTKAWIQSSIARNKLNTELIALFPLFRNQGLKIGILSNATSAMRGRLEKYNIPELVDEIVISSEIGFQKPHKEAFEILFDKLDVRSHEAIFVDDSPKSLEKAAEIGYLPILFESNEQLRKELKGMGILVD